MSTQFLATSGLSKSFGETRALQEVSIQINAGRVHTILGENGSGKSTLVKVLSGVVVPDEGHITIDDQRVTATNPAGMLALGTAVVLQEVLVAPNRSVLDNIMLGQDGIFNFSSSKAEKKSAAMDILAGLTDRSFDLGELAGNLPLHEQQIVVTARGFARQPRFLILDEVTAALDLADRDRLFSAIRRYTDEGGAVAFVSHRMPEILDLSDEVIVMRNGFNTATLSGSEINPETLLAHLVRGAGDG